MKACVFNIAQNEYHPNDYDDGNVKQGSTPLITQKMIDDGLSRRSIKQYAYIWHDKDVYTKDEEEENPQHVAGQPKARHVQIVLNCPNKVDTSSVAKWIGIPENFIGVPKGRGAFLDCVEYLTHESEKEQEAGNIYIMIPKLWLILILELSLQSSNKEKTSTVTN